MKFSWHVFWRFYTCAIDFSIVYWLLKSCAHEDLRTDPVVLSQFLTSKGKLDSLDNIWDIWLGIICMWNNEVRGRENCFWRIPSSLKIGAVALTYSRHGYAHVYICFSIHESSSYGDYIMYADAITSRGQRGAKSYVSLDTSERMCWLAMLYTLGHIFPACKLFPSRKFLLWDNHEIFQSIRKTVSYFFSELDSECLKENSSSVFCLL